MRIPELPRQLVQFLFLVLIVVSFLLVFLNELPWFFLLLLLLFLILLLWFLFGGEEEVSPPPPKYPPEEFYVQDEIVISGPETAVDEAVGIVNDSQEVQFNEIDKIDFGELSDIVRGCLDQCSEIEFQEFVIKLYKFTGTEEGVTAAIKAINDAVGRGSDVRAEPNWLSGYPWEPTGSPWEPTGSPWEPTGSSASEENSAPAEQFMKQWAFEQIGLNRKQDSSSGRNVRIGVFDTSPIGEEDTTNPATLLSWVLEPDQMEVSSDNQYHLPEEKDDEVDLSSHGLFAAGMAHAIAPHAEKQIYRVLNKNNKGELYWLMKALFDFIKTNSNNGSSDDTGMYGAVINMSLGIRVPPDEAGMPLPFEVESLRILLRAAKCGGIVVVAAAGNHSANLHNPEPANLPGNWPEIIGVAASDQALGRACFSNRGNLAAPGGDGKTKEDDPNSCEPANDSCEQADCEFAVIGPVLKKDNNTGFAYWSGTSFSAPLVAGLAACVIEKGQGQLTPDEVRRIIECCATKVDDSDLGVGIINVPDTLDDFYDCLEKAGISIDLPEPVYNKEKEAAE